MDILYIHPAKQEVEARYDKYRSCPPYPFIPVGIVGLVNLLRAEGYDVQGLNLPVELVLRPTFNLRQWLHTRRTPPKLVMIDLHWYEHSFGALEVARSVKETLADVKIVIGGLTTSYYGEEILADFPYVDYAIRGDAEEPLRQLAAQVVGNGSPQLDHIPNLIRQPSGHSKPAQNLGFYFADSAMLDSLDFVSLDWLAHPRAYAAFQYSGAGLVTLHKPKLLSHWLTVGRGCVFDCIYCGGGKESHSELAGRNGYVMRAPDAVVADVARLAAQGCQQVNLSLDIATFPAKWWRAFFQQLRNENIRIGIYNEFFQLPSHDFLDEFGASADLSHTEVAISPLSGNEDVRKRNGKFYTNDRFLRMLETLKKYEVPIFIYFSLNLPGETPQTFKETLYLADRIGKIYPHHLLRMLNPCHTLDPMSPMSRHPHNFDMDVHYRTFQDYYTYCKGTAWEPRRVVRGQHRGFEMVGRPTQIVEKMAQIWDVFAQAQQFRCFPVPRGW